MPESGTLNPECPNLESRISNPGMLRHTSSGSSSLHAHFPAFQTAFSRLLGPLFPNSVEFLRYLHHRFVYLSRQLAVLVPRMDLSGRRRLSDDLLLLWVLSPLPVLFLHRPQQARLALDPPVDALLLAQQQPPNVHRGSEAEIATRRGHLDVAPHKGLVPMVPLERASVAVLWAQGDHRAPIAPTPWRG